MGDVEIEDLATGGIDLLYILSFFGGDGTGWTLVFGSLLAVLVMII